MRKWIALAVCVLLVLGTAACGGSQKETSAPSTEQQTQAVTTEAATAVELPDVFALQADTPYVTEEGGVLFSVAFDPAKTLPASLALLRDGEEIGTLADSGADGDTAAGDGVFSLYVDHPVPGAEARFCAKLGEHVSDSTIVYLFSAASEAEVKAEEDVLASLQSALASVDVSAWRTGKQAETDTLLKKLQEEGTVRLYSVDESGLYMKLASGLSCVFNPFAEDTQGAGTKTDIVIYEATDEFKDRKVYPHAQAQALAGFLPDYAQGAVYQNAACDRAAVKKLGKNQMVLWNGHGCYHRNVGPCLILGEKYNPLSEMTNAEYRQDCVEDRIVNSIGDSISGENWGLAISSKYIDKYCGDLSDSFVYLSACHSVQSDEMARAFLKKGAAAVCGYTEQVKISYAGEIEKLLFVRLAKIDSASRDFYTLKDAVNYAVKEVGASDAGKPYNGLGAAPRIVGGSSAENYRVSRAGTLGGTVTGKDGKKAADVSITFQMVGADGSKSEYVPDSKPVPDSSGKYEVGLPPAKYEISVTAKGYKTFTKTISIEAGKKQTLDVKLEAEPKNKLSGHFKIYSFADGGTALVKQLASMGMSFGMVFKENGTGYYYNTGNKWDLTWDSTTITIDGSMVSYKLDGDTLELIEEGRANNDVYKRTKDAAP